tara:strand:- start:9920 stop:10693 length:774 start_codon:yes stop_codon:yes gene_type:complete
MLFAGVAMTAFNAAGSVAIAQETGEAEETENTESLTLNRVVATGTRIANSAPAGSTIDVLTPDDLAAYPATNVVEKLNQLPYFSAAGNNEASRASVGQGAGQLNLGHGSDINLGGIGPSATLVLFDSTRMPPTGATGGQADSSFFPTMVLDRVDIVADGGSAIYSSDAVAGIVNFIPKRSHDGTDIRISGTSADSYDRYGISGVTGFDWLGAEWVIAGDYSESSGLIGTERDFIRSDLTAMGGMITAQTSVIRAIFS